MTIEEIHYQYERQCQQKGYRCIAGVDEVGRGPLAGPVVAAAVILPSDLDSHTLAGVRDSKQLSESARERFYETITHTALSYAVAHATPREIDLLNIRKASLLAMRRAVEYLSIQPDYVLVDGRDNPFDKIPGEAVVKGDQLSLTIGAASILAKVSRDRMMDSLHSRYPQYGFDRHKGYPTQYHRDALKLFGSSEIHRTTFAHVPDKHFVPQTTPAFQDWVKNWVDVDNEATLARLEKEFSALDVPEMERAYLKNRIKYAQEAIHKTKRQGLPANVDVGADRETLAIEYLMLKGYRLWERNFHCREGEIDLVMNRDSLLVFVEVKSRSNANFGMPYEAVTAAKRRKIIRAAECYLYQRGLLEGWDIRYDIISILSPKNSGVQLEHFEDAFRVEGELG